MIQTIFRALRFQKAVSVGGLYELTHIQTSPRGFFRIAEPRGTVVKERLFDIKIPLLWQFIPKIHPFVFIIS